MRRVLGLVQLRLELPQLRVLVLELLLQAFDLGLQLLLGLLCLRQRLLRLVQVSLSGVALGLRLLEVCRQLGLRLLGCLQLLRQRILGIDRFLELGLQARVIALELRILVLRRAELLVGVIELLLQLRRLALRPLHLPLQRLLLLLQLRRALLCLLQLALERVELGLEVRGLVLCLLRRCLRRLQVSLEVLRLSLRLLELLPQ
mmetsp:Transcript_36719/g.86856  ORF Transcript_36719/g.86856 Transcript_36719/m.86856 type:complete len:203 (+) Transcript_36719:824-1432(+)